MPLGSHERSSPGRGLRRPLSTVMHATRQELNPDCSGMLQSWQSTVVMAYPVPRPDQRRVRRGSERDD